jgi:hypothetical protein
LAVALTGGFAAALAGFTAGLGAGLEAFAAGLGAGFLALGFLGAFFAATGECS